MSENHTLNDVSTPESENSIVAERREKLAKIREARVAYPNDFVRKDTLGDLAEQYASSTKEDLEAKRIEVAVAGRLMLKRVMGKASFVTVQDFTGSMQFFIREDAVGAQNYDDFKTFDLGDIIAATGYLFRTNTGELAVHVESLRLMAKNLRPLPDKFKGLQDTEMCYRQRYVDLIVNPESRQRFLTPDSRGS